MPQTSNFLLSSSNSMVACGNHGHAPLHAPPNPSALLHAPCTCFHTPPYPLCTPPHPLCPSVPLHAPLHTLLCLPLHPSTSLSVPLCAPFVLPSPLLCPPCPLCAPPCPLCTLHAPSIPLHPSTSFHALCTPSMPICTPPHPSGVWKSSDWSIALGGF